jgi:hypothetical protein
MHLLGENLKEAPGSKTLLSLQGVYSDNEGGAWEVNHTFKPIFDGTTELGGEEYDVLRWSRFGPFDVPFGHSRSTGVFRGHIVATRIQSDGATEVGPDSPPIEITVQPSMVIETLRPYFSECSAPAIRGIEGLPYFLRVRTIGLTPERYRFVVTNINGEDGFVEFEKLATSYGIGTLGDSEPFFLNPVPEEQQNTVVVINVEAIDPHGEIAETALPFSVHRNIEVISNGAIQVAEYYPPVPVSACIPGVDNNEVLYSESDMEVRQKSVSVTISKQWSEAYGVTNSSNWPEGYTEGTVTTHGETWDNRLTESSSVGESYGVTYGQTSSSNMSFSSSDGETWSMNRAQSVTESEWQEVAENNHWDVNESVTAGAEGGASVPLVAEGKVYAEATVGGEYGQGSSDTLGNRKDIRSDLGYSVSASHNDTLPFGSATTDSRSESVTGDYRLTRTSSSGHAISDSEARSESRTYSLGGSDSLSETV